MTRTLRVSIPGSIVYVSGTVNSVSVTWTLVDGAWQTVADRSTDDVYVVSITATNSVGTSNQINMTLYYGLHLVTDRTQSDVANRTEKGHYNASDLNRVGAAIKYVADRFAECGYGTNVTPKTDWTMQDIPTQVQMTNYLSYVSALRGVLMVMQSTPAVPASMSKLNYTRANDIEQILLDVDTLITNMTQAWYFANDLYSGEV